MICRFLYGSTNFLSLKTFFYRLSPIGILFKTLEVDKSIALTTFIISIFILENVQVFFFRLYHKVVRSSRVDHCALGRPMVHLVLNVHKTFTILSLQLFSWKQIGTLRPPMLGFRRFGSEGMKVHRLCVFRFSIDHLVYEAGRGPLIVVVVVVKSLPWISTHLFGGFIVSSYCFKSPIVGIYALKFCN